MTEICPATSLRLHEALYQASPMAIITLDTERRVTLWNPAAERIFGWSKEEVLGRPYPLVQDEILRAEFEDNMARNLAGETFQGLAIERCRRDGARVQLSASSAPLKDNQNRCIGILLILEDVSARQATEKELRDTRQHLEHLFESGPGVLYTCRTDGDFGATFVSGNIQEVLGYRAERFTADPSFWLERVHPDDRDGVLRDMERLFENSRLTHEYRFRHSDGGYHWMYDDAKLIRDPDGRPEKILGTWIDITGRKQAEDEMQASKERFRNLFESAPDGMYLMDLNGTFLGGNAAAEEIVGYQREELIGRTFLDLNLLDQQDLAIAAANLGRSTQGETTGPDEFWLRRKDGEMRPIEVRTIPLQVGEQVEILGIARDISERKRAELELRQAKERFQAIVDSAPVLLYTLDREGRFIFSEGAALERIQMKREDLIERCAFEIFGHYPFILAHGEPSTLAEVLRQALAGEEISGTIYLQDFDFHYHVRLQPQHDEQSEFIGVRGIAWDVTEQKKLEIALRTSEERLQTVIENAPVVLFSTDSDGIFTLSRGRGLAAAGLKRDELVGQSALELYSATPVYPDCGETMTGKDAFERALRGEAFSAKVALGQVVYDTRLLPLYNDQGEAVGVTGISLDVSERHQTEEALRQSEREYRRLSEEFRTLLDGIPDSILLLDRDLRIIWTNRAAAENLKVDYATMPGRHCYALTRQRTEPCPDCSAVRCFSSGQTETSKGETPDGRIWGRKAFPIKDATGQVVKVIELVSDITERTRLREEAIRTSRLASLGELAAGVAHEINNPNALVLLNMPILQETWPAIAALLDEHYAAHGDFKLGKVRYSRLREWMPALHEEILGGAQRIRRIVEDLKDFVSHSDTQEMKPVCMNKVVQATLRLLANTIKNSTDAFHADLANGLPKVCGDFARLEQVVVNLVVNACQALPQRSCAVKIATRHDAAGGFVVLEVHDQGGGILPENLERITDPFFTTKRENGGTGLGLSVSARIVREHKGKLRFASQPGQGTTVTLELPAEEQE